MVTWRALFDRAAEHEATTADVRAALAARRTDGEGDVDRGTDDDATGVDRRGGGDDARS